MNPQDERAWVLYSQGRYDEAEREAGLALAADPNSPQALVTMSLCLLQRGQFDDATDHAERAVAQAPDDDSSHYILALVWYRRNYLERAADAVQQAVRLDPYDADYYVLLGQIRLAQKRYPDALEAADSALAIDPEETDALNLRSQTLRQSGRKDAAVDGLRDALELDPEDTDTHANLAWNYLEQGNLAKAQEHFREALRLDPESEWARLGLIETIKSRNVAYRLLLNWFLWMQKKTARHQWMIVVVAFVAYMACIRLVKTAPALGIVLWPLLWAYVIFCLLTWFATPLSNLALRLHPLGRLVLSRMERTDAMIVGLAVLITLIAFAFHFCAGSTVTYFVALPALSTTVAICMVTLLRVPKARKIMAIYAVFVGVVSLFVATGVPMAIWLKGSSGPLISLWRSLTLLSLGLSRWTMLGALILVNILSLKNWTDTPD